MIVLHIFGFEYTSVSKVVSMIDSIIGLQTQTWRWIEISICTARENGRPKFSLLIFFEVGAYDGVELSVKTTNRLCTRTWQEIRNAQVALQDQADGFDHQQDEEQELLDIVERHTAKSTAKSKVLQSEASNVMVFSHYGKRFVIQGEHVVWLQRSDRTTSECLLGMLHQQRTTATQYRDLFNRLIRLMCTDRYEPNKIAEKKVTDSIPNASSFHSYCHPHMLAGSINSV